MLYSLDNHDKKSSDSIRIAHYADDDYSLEEIEIDQGQKIYNDQLEFLGEDEIYESNESDIFFVDEPPNKPLFGQWT